MKRFWIIFPTFLLFGCNEYTAQLCTEDVRIDVPGLEATWKLVGYDQEAFAVQNSSAKLSRLAKGVYLATGRRGALFTCNVGGRTLLEEQNQAGNWQSYVLSNNGKGFDLTVTVFDKAAVDASGIPSSIVEVERGKVLVVDNAKVADPKKVADLLNSSSFLVRLY